MPRKIFVITLVFIFLLLIASVSFAEFREIKFGRYYSEANSRELTPIEWLVLAENDEGILLLTKKSIDEISYNNRREIVAWENCSLRKWLNEEFLKTAFNASERDLIIPAILSDKIFVLDHDEVLKYLPNESDRQCMPTEYSRSQGTYINGEGLCAWWTRSNVKNKPQAEYLSSYGTFGSRPHYVDDKVIGVRPAIWLKKNFLESSVAMNEVEAERFLYSVKPDSRKAFEIETRIQPMLKQEKPFKVKELYDYFLKNPQKAIKEFDRKRIEVKGIVLRTGPDRAFGQPSIELSDESTGKCYVLCVFQDERAYSAIKHGDEITVRGNYLVVYEGYGIVLKISELI